MKRTFRGLFSLPAALAIAASMAFAAPPAVEILSPPEGGLYLPGTGLNAFASAKDDDGLVEQVEFFLNGVSIGTVPGRDDLGLPSVAVYELPFVLPAVPSGVDPTYILTAVATDNDGETTVSAPVNFRVRELDEVTPRIVMTHPLPLGDGDFINDTSVAGETWLNAEVFDPDNPDLTGVTVNFYANGQLLATVTEPVGDTHTYATYLDFSFVGFYSLYAKAVDADGNEGQSVPLGLEVLELQAPMPKVEVLPIFGERAVEQPIPLYAETDGSLAGITRVDFFADGVLLDSVVEPLVQNGTKSIYSINWEPSPAMLAGGTTNDVEITARAVQVDPNTLPADNWRISAPTIVSLKEKLFDAPVTRIDLASPVDGSSYTLGMQVPLIADLQTSGAGATLQVDFYANGEVVGSATSAPFRIYWNPNVSGNYALSAVVTEIGRGVLASAPPIAVEIDAGTSEPRFTYVGPALYGTAPTDPPTYPSVSAGSDVQLTAEVSMMKQDVDDLDGDGDTTEWIPGEGNIEQVRFFVNGQELAADTTEPFATFWTPSSAGTYQIEAEAVDHAGRLRLYSQQYTVEERTLAVVNPVGQVPSVSLSTTANGNVTPGSRVVAKAYVFDEDPEGVTMTFFVNGSQVGTPDTAPPFSVVLEPVGGLFENIYSVTALATDSDGNSRAKTLAPLYISDVSVDHPGVALVSPAPDSILTEGSRASLRAQVVGATANIAEVQFYANGELIGSDSTAPYAIDWLPDQLGAVEITAAVLQKTEQYDHDDNFETPLIPVTPVMVANPVPVTVNPPVGVLPAISFQVLPDQVDLAQGAEIILYADAQDLDGTVASVQFFLDGVPLGMPVTTPPFSVGWIAQGEGIHYLHAVATDNEGNVVNSNFESVEVAPRVISTPSIDLTLPTAASQAGDFITLRSSVRDFVNGPDGVVFYVDGQAVGTSNEKPYNYVWEANLEGTVSVFATARFPLGDGSVVTAASSAQTLTLAADADPVIESFSVSWPGQSSAKPNPLVGEMLAFSVTATDNGHVERLELLRNGETVQLLDVDRSTILLEETPPGLGSYTYSVVVTDNAGRQTASGGLDVTVVLGQPPVLALTAPETGDEYLPGEAITVRATASDADGTVVGVQFFVNGTPVGEVDTVAPYAYTFTPSGAGDYAFTARAEDNSGNFTATPAAVTVEVLTDDPPSFANFGINLEHGDGTQGSPYIVRVGTSFTIDTEASDDQGVRSVALLRNSTEVPAPAGAEVPIQFSDTLDAPGLYGYRAEVIDTGDNVTSSERLYVRAIQGQRPLVTIDQPFDGAQVEVDQSTPIRVTATPADEPQGPLGSIAQVEFRANGTTFATRTQAPYTAGFTPASEGQWEISVVATSDTGINSTEAIATLNAVDEELPEIQSFTNDTTGNQTLFGLPITFEVVASDELGIRRVEFYRMGRTAPLGEASAAPYTFTYTPTALDSGVPGEDDPIPAGTHLFYARAVNAAGVSVDSEPAEINIRHPEPLTLVEDYIFQSYLDFLLRIPTPEERAAAISQFDTSLAPVEQDAAAAVVLDLLDDPEFVPVRSTLLAYELLTGAWPSRADLESGVRLVREAADVDFAALDNTARAAALRQLVQLLLPSYAGDHGSSLPTAASSSSEIDAFTSALWETKYGAPLADPSVARARFRAFGREDFVARFLLDVGLVTSPTGTSYTPVLGFANPPNDRYAEWGVAAAVLGLLRDSSEFAPEQTRVEEYAALLPGERVLRALASDAYRERFEVGDIALVHLEDNWKASSWLGEYMAFDDGWNYHVELGYLYFDMEDARPDGMWYFDLSTGWTWTRGDIVPHVYSHKLQSWLFWVPSDYEASGGQRWFYNYDEAGWRSY